MQSIKLRISSSIANKHKICTYRDMANLSRYIFSEHSSSYKAVPEEQLEAPPFFSTENIELRNVKKKKLPIGTILK